MLNERNSLCGMHLITLNISLWQIMKLMYFNAFIYSNYDLWHLTGIFLYFIAVKILQYLNTLIYCQDTKSDMELLGGTVSYTLKMKHYMDRKKKNYLIY